MALEIALQLIFNFKGMVNKLFKVDIHLHLNVIPFRMIKFWAMVSRPRCKVSILLILLRPKNYRKVKIYTYFLK